MWNCCSPLVVPVVRGEVGPGYCHLFFVCSFLAPLSLTAFSVSSRQLLSVTNVLHSSPSLSRCLLRQFSHHIIGLPRLPFHSTFWTSPVFPIFHLLLLISFFLHLSFTPTSIPSSPNLLIRGPLFSIPRFFLPSCFRKPAPSPVVSLLVPSFLNHICIPGSR